MPKPKYITIIRHGKSTGNADKDIYHTIPDYALQLTDEGIEQVKVAAESLKEYVPDSVAYYVSSYWRTRQTYMLLKKTLPEWRYYETPDLREQEWHTAFGVINPDHEAERERYGHFYYRYITGESNADVYTRIGLFLDTLYRDFNKPDFPSTAIIVCHGMTMRVFLMRFLHMTVEEFELLANPKNAEYYVLELQQDGRYELITEPRKYEKQDHDFQFNWNDPRFQ